jgi:hypothetical protein
MPLDIQIQSLLFSFFYGIISAFGLNVNNKYIYSNKRIVKVTISMLLAINICILYFIFLKKINYGIVHPYFIFLCFLGFYLGKKIITRFDL